MADVYKIINGISLGEKAWDVIQDETRYVSLEGSTGTQKSLTADRLFHKRVYKSSRQKTQFAIIGTSSKVLEKNIIQNPLSFYNRHRWVVKNGKYVEVMKYYKQGTGGSRIEWNIGTQRKYIYFAGFDDKSRYKEILGMTLYGIWCDEIQVAHDDFVGELFTRLSRDGGFLITTSNAGLPDQKIYVDYLNKGRPSQKWLLDVPIETMKELNKSKPDIKFRFYWFGFKDNPLMTEDQIEDLYSVHPVGSFEYNSKILAIRGYIEGLLYARYIDNTYISKYNYKGSNVRFSDINHFMIRDITIGVDIGSGTEKIKEDTSRTVWGMVGYTKEYQRGVVLDANEAQGVIDYNEIIKQFNTWLMPYWTIYRTRIKGIYVESADPLFINTLRNNLNYPIPVLKSIKKTIKERRILKQQLLNQNRLLFSDLEYAQKTKGMLAKIKSDGKDGHLDDGKIWIDYNDWLDYALTPRMTQLSAYKMRRVS
jgi:hypothetical protein